MNTSPKPATESLSVLIVDDHAAVRESMRECIRAFYPNVSFLEAACGEDAVALATAEWPQIVLMDISMPGVDGIEAARWIRARVPGSYVVMVSVHEDEAHRAAAAEAGAAAFVAKRDLPGDLMRLLDEVVPCFRRASASGAGYFP